MNATHGILSDDVDMIAKLVVEKIFSEDNAEAQEAAKLAVREARTCLASILERGIANPVIVGQQAEAAALAELVFKEADGLQAAYGYSRAQAWAVKIADLTRFQFVVELAGDNAMLENIRRVKATMIQALSNADLYRVKLVEPAFA